MSRPSHRRTLLVVLVVALVATFVGCGPTATQITPTATEPEEGGEVSYGDTEDAEAIEPLTLTLRAPEICETERARNVGGWELRTNEEGARVREFVSAGWRVFAETPVRWRVDGGAPPYTLTIDGERRDARWAYHGQFGEASVGCVDSSVGTFFEEVSPQDGVTRLYRADPNVDSGWKTVRGVVTDVNGRTAEATIAVYVLLDLGTGTSGEILLRGQTYRVLGFLLTAPEDYDVEVGGVAQRECAEDDPDPRCGETIHDFLLVGVDAWVYLYEDGSLHERHPEASEGAAGASVDSLDVAIDSLVNSVGQPPD